MKRLVFVVTFFFCALTCVVQVPALNWTDDMSDTNSNSIKSYSNLTPVSQGGYGRAALNFIWGQNAMTLTNANAPGVAEYRVQGARTVSVGIYTPVGTFVASSPYDSSHVFGVFQANMNHLRNQQVAQTLYSPTTGNLYARIGGEVRKLIYIDNMAVFEADASPPSDLRCYGVNVYVNGSSSPLSVAQSCLSSRLDVMDFDAGIPICYELLTFSLPENAQSVRVEINDFRTVDLMENGTARQRSWPANGQHTALGVVTFEGNDLQLGKPEPVINPSPSDSTSEISSEPASRESSSSSSSGKPSSSTAAGSTGAAAATGSSTAHISKFEGQIASVGSASSSAARTAPSASATSTPPISDPLSEDGFFPESTGPEFFRLEPARASGSASSGILLYIIVIAGVILFLILRGRQNK